MIAGTPLSRPEQLPRRGGVLTATMRVAIGIPFLISWSTPLDAQSGVTLRGIVRDSATSRPVDDASVVVTSGTVALTTESGRFELGGLTQGEHILTVRKPGYLARNFRVDLAGDRRDVDVGSVLLGRGLEPTTSIVGTVESVFRKPVEHATVALNGHLVALTDSAGRFRIKGVGRGFNLLEMRRLGYAPKAVGIELTEGSEDVVLNVALDILPVELTEIVVDAERRVYVRGRLREFYERLQSGHGHYITRWEIERRSPSYVTDLFRQIPSLLMVERLFGGRHIRTTRLSTCLTPKVFLDGVRMFGFTDPGSGLSDIDSFVRPEDVEGIELYLGPAIAPARYSLGSSCGVILIWTR